MVQLIYIETSGDWASSVLNPFKWTEATVKTNGFIKNFMNFQQDNTRGVMLNRVKLNFFLTGLHAVHICHLLKMHYV